MAGFTTTASSLTYKSSNINDLKNWHGGCKA
jgi:hypothetical protein